MILLLLSLLSTQGAAKDDLPGPKRITLNLTNVTLEAAATRLSKDGGYEIQLGACDPGKKLTLKTDRLPFVQAVHALCRAAGIAYRWSDGVIELIKDVPTAPASSTQAGPFSIRAWVGPLDFEEEPFLRFETDWEPGVNLGWFVIKVDALKDDKGTLIPLQKMKEARTFGEVTYDAKLGNLSIHDDTWKEDFFSIAPPAKSVTKLKSVSGTLTLGFPAGKLKTVRFENPSAGMTQDIEGSSISLRTLRHLPDKKVWNGTVNLNLAPVPAEKRVALYGLFVPRRIRFFSKDGTALPNPTLGSYGSDGPRDAPEEIHVSGYCRVPDATPLGAVELDFYSDVTLKTVSFEILDLPVVKPGK